MKRSIKSIVTALLALALATLPRLAAAAPSDGLEYVGSLDVVSASARMVADSIGSNLVTFENPASDPFTLSIRVFDAEFRPRTKLLVPEATLTIPPLHAWDQAHRTLYLVTFPTYLETLAWTRPSLLALDVATMQVRKTPFPAAVFPPGWRMLGMSFSPATGHLHAVAAVTSSLEVEPGTRSVVVTELDPATGAPTLPAPGFVAVPRCQGVFAVSQQAVVAYDAKLRSLFVSCRATTVALVSSPGSPAVVRVGLADPARPEIELYPVSGSYGSGVALADASVRRLVMISAAGTNEAAYVFDQHARKYLGVVSIAGQFRAAGMNGALGHLYVMTADRLLVSSYTGVKIPQAISFDVGEGVLQTQVMVSPSRNLIAVPVREKNGVIYKIYRDNLPPFVEPESDPDATTSDVAEREGVTETSFSGEGRAFGFRVHGVGGFNGIAQNVAPNGNADYWRNLSAPTTLVLGLGQRYEGCAQAPDACALIAKPGNLSDGDRDVYAARVIDARLSGDEALASSETMTVDHGTRSDYATLGDGREWPYGPARCIDQGAGPAAQVGDDAIAECSRAKGFVDTRVTFSRATVAGLVTAAWSSSSVRIERSASLGAHVVSFAEARDVRIGDDVFIGRIASQAETAARGRPGTSAARHRVWFENVRTPAYSCADECDVRAVATALAEALGEGVEVELPAAEVIATPRGAQGSVLRLVTDQQQDVVFNNQSETGREVPALRVAAVLDNTERSRVVYDLAAAQAVSTYTISSLPNLPNEPPVVLPPLPDTLPGVGPLPQIGLGRNGGGTKQRSILVPARPWRFGLVWSPRSALVAATWTFFALPLLLAYRRRSIAVLRRSRP